MYYSVVIVTVKMTILCRESRLYSIVIFLLPPFDRDKNICKNKRVPLTENNKTIYNPIFDSYKTKNLTKKSRYHKACEHFSYIQLSNFYDGISQSVLPGTE